MLITFGKLSLTHVQQAGGGGGETLEFIDEAGNTEITSTGEDYANVTAVTTYIDFSGCTALETIDFTSLESVGDGLYFSNCAALTAASFPALESVVEGLVFSDCLQLTTANFTSLTTTAGITFTSCTVLTTVDFSDLVSAGALEFNGCTALTSADFSSLSTTNGMNFGGCSSLVTLAFSALTAVAASVAIDNCALSQASVDGILVKLASLDGTGGTTTYDGQTVDLSGGTNAPPTSAGLAAKATLEGRGCTVTINENIDFNGNTEITEADYPDVTVVTTYIEFSDCTALTTANFPLLERVDGDGIYFAPCAALTTIDFSSLETVLHLKFTGSVNLSAASFPALAAVGGQIGFDGCTGLNSFSAPSLLSVGDVVTFNNCGLDQASVDAILVKFASMDGTEGTTSYDGGVIDITGGTNAVPSATGLTAKATLEGRGNTVTVNE